MLYYKILDKERLEVVKYLKNFKKDFYLGGGTALALQIGHRDSVDFDFFSKKDIDTQKLFQMIKDVFKNFEINKIQEEENTLTVIIGENVKLSFFTLKVDLIEDFVSDENLKLASVLDIALMKLNAITSRATSKDYIDLYFILKKYKLEELLIKLREKFPNLDEALVLKSLVYFDDIEEEEIEFSDGFQVELSEVEGFLEKVVKKTN
ncbi:MAG: hypothetical protein GF347_04170 [Candidatus Moranbacteria bacterium]|nr:hypothetical protein [Candidatus Moranbacteria bacterium]